MLMDGKLKNAKQKLYTGLYLFCTTGLSFSDMCNLCEENTRRLKYVRFTDDFLIGTMGMGTKAERERIKVDMTNFMKENLKLKMFQERTLITDAQKHTQFLGYEIFIRKDYVTR